MEAFFEAWVEAVARRLAPLLGAVVRSGRLRQTLTPVAWDPPFTGSQRYLLPDVLLETSDGTVVLDAKYKDHWEDLAVHRWGELGTDVRDHHRTDLLQVLAYTAPLAAARVGACLVYPCRRETWESLADRGRLFHRAAIGSGDRIVRVLLTALPMADEASGGLDLLAPELRGLLTVD
jgi:5-methylcytosine-specific restriction endonuclease McrBC regulatory subunit McrC